MTPARSARKGKGLQAPRIPEVRLENLEPGDPDDLESGARIDGQEFSGLETGQLDLGNATLMECSFADLAVDEADLRSVRLRDSVIARSRIGSLRGGRGDWRDVRIEGVRIGSAEMYENTWTSVHFVDCKLTYLNLRAAGLRDVAFTRCTIEELDLADAKARSVAFTETEVRVLDVQRAELNEVDLRGAQLHRITGLGHLRGTTVTSVQLTQLAPLLAAEFGMTVDDTAPQPIPPLS